MFYWTSLYNNQFSILSRKQSNSLLSVFLMSFSMGAYANIIFYYQYHHHFNTDFNSAKLILNILEKALLRNLFLSFIAVTVIPPQVHLVLCTSYLCESKQGLAIISLPYDLCQLSSNHLAEIYSPIPSPIIPFCYSLFLGSYETSQCSLPVSL